MMLIAFNTIISTWQAFQMHPSVIKISPQQTLLHKSYFFYDDKKVPARSPFGNTSYNKATGKLGTLTKNSRKKVSYCHSMMNGQ